MRVRCFLLLSLSFLLSAAPAAAQPAKGELKPVLRLEAGGPTSNVTALAFSPDSKFLYAAGHDKVVRVWAFQPQTRTFVFQDDIYYRVPIGRGLFGAINALALSDDGSLLAVGGFGVTPASMRFDETTGALPSELLTDAEREDLGVIYVFDTKQRKLWKTLRGHAGEVRSLAFVERGGGQPPALVSAARVQGGQTGKRSHEVFVWSPGAKEPLLARLPGLPAPAGYPPPALAVWPSKAGAPQLRVAIALTDGKLRVWEPAADGGKGTVVSAEARLNSTAAFFPTGGPDPLLTGTVALHKGTWKGALRSWRVTPPALHEGDDFILQGDPSENFSWVKALSLFSPKPTSEVDHAALILGESKRLGYALEVRGPSWQARPIPFAQRKAHVPLWSGTSIWPALATSRRGDYIAVAGSPDHRILVFPVASLLVGKAPRQEIRSAGASFVSTRFAARGEGKTREVGLILEEAPAQAGGAPTVLTFNVSKGTIADGKSDWQPEEQDRRPWTTQLFPAKDGSRQVVVWNGEQQAASIPISAAWLVQARTVIPPSKVAKVPLLAVALFAPDTSETAIHVYNVATRELVVVFTGHQAPIRSLSVSRDARLLASTADDQTLCVWSLTDLLKALGQLGGAPGLVLTPGAGGKGVVVAGVAADRPGTRNLTKGMAIDGIVRDGKLQKLKTPEELYQTMLVSKPGRELTVRAGKGGQFADVPITLGQGPAEHTPLLTLFVTHPQKDGARDWVGWSPSGVYEASRRPAEDYLGWHFNTGKPAAPTSFSPIGQMRDKYYKKGIVNKLIAQANLEGALGALVPPPRPLPVLALEAYEGNNPLKADAKSQLLVRQPNAVLLLDVGNYEREDAGDVATWRLNGGPPQPLVREGKTSLWSAAVNLPLDKGSLHTVEAEFRLRERKDAPARSGRLTLRYQPPAPALVFTGAKDQTVRQPAFTLKLEVRPGAADVPVDLTFSQENEGKEVDRSSEQVKGVKEIEKKFILKKGENLVRVQARNQKALAGFESKETDELTLRVTYDPLPVVAERPNITLQPALPLTQEGEPVPVSVESGRTVSVSVPKVRFRGEIKGKEALTVAQLEHPEGKDDKVRKLPPLPKDRQVCAVDETVSLVPGLQTVRFRAKSANSPEAVRTVQIDYRPLPPKRFTLRVVRPALDGLILFEDKELAERTVDVRGDFTWPKDKYPGEVPLQATLLVNGKEVPGVKAVVKGDTVTASDVPLAPRDNHIQIRLTSPWGGNPVSGYVHVRYLRPPQLVGWDNPAVDQKKPLAQLTARVWSAPPLRKETVRVSVNGTEVRPDEVDVAPAGAVAGRWLVTLKGVPLGEGKNKVRLRVANDEGEVGADAEAPAKAVEVAWMKPAPKTPKIIVLAPSEGGRIVTRRAVEVRFRVESEVPLTRVVVRRGDTEVFKAPAVALRTPQGGKDLYEFTAKVPLEWNLNDVRVEAANGGLPAEHKLTVTAERQGAEVVFDWLEVLGRGKLAVPFAGSLQRLALPGAQIWLEGKVRWPDADFQELKEARTVRVYVNGFQQVPAELGPAQPVADGVERSFKAPLVLNLKEGNLIEVKLPGIVLRGDSRRDLAVNCEAPGKEAVAHVVVIAPRERDAGAFQQGLKLALEKAGVNRVYKVQAHPPLTQENGRPVAFGKLLEIRRAIKARALGDFPKNDVVLLYYQGPETLREDGHYFWTGDTAGERDLERTGIDLGRLAGTFDDFLGAQVLLLDVNPRSKGSAAQLLRRSLSSLTNPGLGLFRHAWLNDAQKTALLKAVEEELPRASKLGELENRLLARFRADQLSREPVYEGKVKAGLREMPFKR